MGNCPILAENLDRAIEINAVGQWVTEINITVSIDKKVALGGQDEQ
jgi:hypothetical protein